MEAGPVLVVDGNRSFRSAVALLVERAGLTAHAVATGDEAFESARACRPSVVILDVGLREPTGYEICRELRELYGEALPILFVSAERTEPGDRVAGLLLGADDYLAKPVDPNELLARIRRSATRSRARSREQPPLARPSPASAAGLTARELEVLRLIAVGQTPHDISEQLVISPKTVSSHLQHILTKLGVNSRLQAVALAYQLGLVTPEEDIVGIEARVRSTEAMGDL